MAHQIRHFIVDVPASTPKATPAVTDIAIPVMRLLQVDWHLPPGCAGLVGFFLSMGGVQVQPLPQGTFVLGEGRNGTWHLDDAPDSGAWQVTAYNTGAQPHGIHLSLHVETIVRRETEPMLLDSRQLSSYSSQLAAWHD
jgi:hypothetical protein